MGIAWAFENIKISWRAERPQLALWLPVGMGIGISIYFALPIEPPAALGWAAAGVFLIILPLSRNDTVRLIATFALSVSVGFAAASWRTAMLSAPILDQRTGPVLVSGTVERVELSVNAARIILSAPSIAGNAAETTPSRIRLSIRGSPGRVEALMPGSLIKARAILRPPPPPTMPGAFDFQRHAYFQMIGAYGFVLGEVERLPEQARAPPGIHLRRFIEAIRLTISRRVHDLQDGDNGAVAAALLTGQRGYIDAPVLKIMRDAGIAHLLAISGLHIGLVAGLVFSGLRLAFAIVPYVGLRLNSKKVAAALAIPVALGYAVLAGFTVPTERAFLMTGLMLVGVLLDRRALSMRSVAWAAAIVLLFRPESLVSPGFQMSFAAVTALIAAYAAIGDWRRRRGISGAGGIIVKSRRYLLGVLVTTVIASAATAPFAIYHFQHAAAFGLLANAVAVPLAALWVMPAGIVTLAGMPFGLEAAPLAIMCTGIDLILTTAARLADLPGAAVDIAAPPVWSLGIITVAGLWLAIWRTRWRLLSAPFLLLGLIGPVFAISPDIIIDGDARLVAALHKDAVYLTSNSRAARFEVADWRQRMGQGITPAAWRHDAEKPQGRLRCDAQGCSFLVDQGTVAISTDASTLEDDCRRSRMIVATVPVRGRCKPPWGIIDRFDLWRFGTHAVTFTDRGPVIRTVNGERGKRPWVNWPDD